MKQEPTFPYNKLKKETFWHFFMDGVPLSQDYKAATIWSTWEGSNTESALELPGGFQLGPTGLAIQCPNHQAIPPITLM